MRRLFLGFLVIAAIAIGGGLIANTAYQAGLSTAVTTVAASAPDGTIVVPVTSGGYPVFGPNGYGYGPGGWGHGFSIFGVLGTLLVLFLVVGLIRAVAFGGRHGRGNWGGQGWGSPGRPGGPGGPGGPGSWAAGGPAAFETWHRNAHQHEDAPSSATPASS